LQSGLDFGSVILSPQFGPREVQVLRNLGIAFFAVDLRLTTDLPLIGIYYDGGELDQRHRAPPRAQALQKFDAVPGIGRVFDNGYVVFYDARIRSGAF
jgi:hypothetical protein